MKMKTVLDDTTRHTEGERERERAAYDSVTRRKERKFRILDVPVVHNAQ